MLEFSTDGQTFHNEVQAREVDEKLRELLRWGVPKTGGQGIADSFLTNVLLAEQADVPGILARGLTGDKDESGREALAQALTALAQEPLFKKVLDAANVHVKEDFTPGGKLKKVKGSRLAQASAELVELNKAREELHRKVEESRVAQSSLLILGQQSAAQRQQREEAREKLEGARRGLQATQHKDYLRQRLARAQELQQLQRQFEQCQERVAVATAKLLEARGRCQAAESAWAQASGEQNAQEAALRRSTLDNERLQLEQRAGALARQLEAARAALRLQEEALESEKALAERREEWQRQQRLDDSAAIEIAELSRRCERLGQAEELARLLEARAALQRCHDRLAQAEQFERQAAEKLAEAEAVVIPAAPTALVLEQLRELQGQLQMAEAKLGGGLSLSLRPLQDVPLQLRVDGVAMDGALEVEAQREIQLRVGDLLELVVTAGEAEQRENLRRLRGRWEAEAEPVLGEATLAAALDLRRQADEAAARVAHLRVQADVEKGQAVRLRQDAGDVAQAERRVAAFPSFDERSLDGLSPAEAPAARKALQSAEEKRKSGAGRLLELQARCQAEEPVVAQLRLRADEAGRHSDRPAADIERDYGDCESRLKDLAVQLEALASETSSAVSAAAAALQSCKAILNQAELEEVDARSLREKEQMALERARGAFGSEVNLAALEVELAGLGEAEVSQEQVAAAEAELAAASTRLEKIDDDLKRAQWNLQQTDGGQSEARLADLEEAISRAREAEFSLEIESKGWKLLVETLRDVENREGTHLGRALSSSVSQRMTELCQGRYGPVGLDSNLKVTDLIASGQPREFLTLSEGTKDQLATLFRLCIARQLGSSVILDDHLNQSDLHRIAWFKELLQNTGEHIQVILITCRPDDYLGLEQRAAHDGWLDISPRFRSVDLGQAIQRFAQVGSP